MDISKMTIEELRELCINQEAKIKEQADYKEQYELKMKEKEDSITSLNNDIQSLKAKNFDLFMKVSNQVEVPHEAQKSQDPKMSLDDITNLMIGDE